MQTFQIEGDNLKQTSESSYNICVILQPLLVKMSSFAQVKWD